MTVAPTRLDRRTPQVTTMTLRSVTTYAVIRAAGKNTRLNRKKPIKLWPFRAATLAGQNAMATQMMVARIQ
jgi:hypothetical protein